MEMEIEIGIDIIQIETKQAKMTKMKEITVNIKTF